MSDADDYFNRLVAERDELRARLAKAEGDRMVAADGHRVAMELLQKAERDRDEWRDTAEAMGKRIIRLRKRLTAARGGKKCEPREDLEEL